MNKDEALKMAISFASVISETYATGGEAERVINACKEALEQPAKDTETMAVAIALQEQIRQLKEQPAQKPLSDDEIDKILDNDDLWKVEGDEVYVRTTEFARAIEQAHGIGVKDGQTIQP